MTKIQTLTTTPKILTSPSECKTPYMTTFGKKSCIIWLLLIENMTKNSFWWTNALHNNTTREYHVVMQIQNIINYNHVVTTNSNQMTWLHVTIYSHTQVTKYSEKQQGVEGQFKMRSQNSMGNALWGTKIVRYDHSHFVWSDWSDMTRLRTGNGVSHQCTLLMVLVINPSYFFVLYI